MEDTLILAAPAAIPTAGCFEARSPPAADRHEEVNGGAEGGESGDLRGCWRGSRSSAFRLTWSDAKSEIGFPLSPSMLQRENEIQFKLNIGSEGSPSRTLRTTHDPSGPSGSLRTLRTLRTTQDPSGPLMTPQDPQDYSGSLMTPQDS
ncbi:unnamed protein product [Pleuronectes platessa]|uniref:Uncharacterized protein n=1 Tax=Pleuronectes platessa TaxID=8262 RepID=A0A9N7Z701_PLEPL|nr:unnamed protein product [Pleuronectes platessa]